MRRLLVTLAYGFAGIVLALALSLGAFALAGRDISDPAEPLGSLTPALAPPTARETPDADRSPQKDDDRDARPTASASDDHGGDDDRDDDGSDSGPGSDDDHVDDNSGSGSDDSGDEHEDD